MSEEPKRVLGSLDIHKVLEFLPHRYPFLVIDKVLEIDGDTSCIGVKNVTINEQIFAGHFPQLPLYPGVLLIEGMAQTAGAICLSARAGGGEPPRKVYFMTIDKCKFRKPVVPGDVVHFHLTKLNQRRNIWWYRGEAKVDGTLVAEAEISAIMGPP